MRKQFFIEIAVLASMLFLMPVMVNAQSDQTQSVAPPISQPLGREGDLALKLANKLGISSTADETEAESQLGSLGITPKNGWIADYPATPDVIIEVQQSISDAVDSGRLYMRKDDALKSFDDATAELNIAVKQNPTGQKCENNANCNYPTSTVINNYYYNQDPPVVTYYTPPQDYYYLYTWVPYPFWWSGFWFSGFFILHDFHKTVIVQNRVVIVSNHFNDFKTHKVFRIDPVNRFHGKTFAGIGAPPSKGFLPTGIPKSHTTIFNHPQKFSNEGKTVAPFHSDGKKVSPFPEKGKPVAPFHGDSKTVSPFPEKGKAVAPFHGDSKTVSPFPSEGKMVDQPNSGEKSGTPFHGDGKMYKPHSK